MSTENNPKWYIIDIEAPYQTLPEDGFGIRERHELPAYKVICNQQFKLGDYKPEDFDNTIQGPGWASAVVGGGDQDASCSFQDLPDRRQAFIRTKRHDAIQEIGKLPGVTVREVESSGFFLVHGQFFNDEELKEERRLVRENGLHGSEEYKEKIFERFDTEVWARVHPIIMNTIQQHDPAAVLYDINNNVKATFIKTDSRTLIEALRNIDGHVVVEEMSPLTTMDDITRMHEYQLQSDQQEPEPPSQLNANGPKPQELNA